MSGYSWERGERGRALTLAVAMLGAALYPLRQHFRPAGQKRDGFPLSYYPMFSARRRQFAIVVYAVAVHADGSRHFLDYHLLGGGGLNQVRRQLRRVVDAGRAGGFVEVVAARVAADEELADIARVEIVRGEFDLDVCLMGHRTEGEETVLASADVVREADVAPELEGSAR
ncbi:MAG TPA: hypothetical protein VGH99_00085 [Pseudonocardia sp.]